MIAACRDAVTIPLFVIIRPRGGGFVYSDSELDVMRRDIIAARALGVDGVVIGALSRDGTVNADQTRSLVEVAPDLPVTFHRAFDFTPDLGGALDTLVSLGVTRVLTSGGAPNAREGVPMLASLVRQAGDRLVVMAGGGVREENVRSIVEETAVQEVHVRLTRLTRCVGSILKPGISVRKPLPAHDADWEETDEERMLSFVRAVG